jgi:hypothetical protein
MGGQFYITFYGNWIGFIWLRIGKSSAGDYEHGTLGKAILHMNQFKLKIKISVKCYLVVEAVTLSFCCFMAQGLVYLVFFNFL